jgi:C4-dicarboxylate-specific signal transduction histidine kinase
MINLVNNACDAMANTPASLRRLSIQVREDDERVRIVVEDSGCGLPDPPEQVFHTFFTTKPDGLGLGLAISRSIVEAHGGTMSAERRDRPGARFVIDLPACRPALQS